MKHFSKLFPKSALNSEPGYKIVKRFWFNFLAEFDALFNFLSQITFKKQSKLSNNSYFVEFETPSQPHT